MLDWLANLSQKPDHPMHSIEEAERLLSGLPEDPLKALEEITSWLTTVTNAAGFRLATRIGIVKLVDETGQPFEPELNRLYLASRALKEFERQQLWQAALQFWERLAHAYRHCLDEIQHDPRLLRAHQDELPLLVVRTLRALANQAKVLRLRYVPVREPLWLELFALYRLSEDARCDNQRVIAYAGETWPTTARQQLLRALMLDAARPDSMLPQQTELAARITARYADAFLFKSAPEAGCNWYVDLSQPRPPEHVTGAATLETTARFFGAGVAIVKIKEVIRRLSSESSAKEQRFGEEYTSQEKLVVLGRLTRFWGEHPPHRSEPRHSVNAELAVAHGFPAACLLVPRAEYRGWAEVILSMDDNLKATLGIISDPANVPQQEKWLQRDASARGLGAEIPRTSESRARIGTLFALKSESEPWCMGVARRLYRDGEDHAHAGIEVLAKKPATVLLRRVGQTGMRVEDWTKSSAASGYDYLNVIVLGANVSAVRHELLLARGGFVAGVIYEAMMGDGKQHLRFEELLEQGEDFDRVRFSWLTGDAAK
jgi:hypothetical protein